MIWLAIPKAWEGRRGAGQWKDMRGIRHVFIPAAEGDAFNKSKARNAGVPAAWHPVLVLLDTDVMPSPDFLVPSLEWLGCGWEAVRPVRFLFLLDEADSLDFLQNSPMRDIREIPLVPRIFRASQRWCAARPMGRLAGTTNASRDVAVKM